MHWRRILSLGAAESFFRHQATVHASEVVRHRLPWPLGALLVVIVALTNPGVLLLAVYREDLGAGVCLLAILWTVVSLFAVGFAAERVTRHLPYAGSIAHWISYRLGKKAFTVAVSIASGIFQAILLIVLVTRAAQLIEGTSGYLVLFGLLVLTSGVVLLWVSRESLRILAYAAGLFVLMLVLLAFDQLSLADFRLSAPFASFILRPPYQRWLVGFLIVLGMPCFLGFDSRLLQVTTSVRRSRLGSCFLLAGVTFLPAAAILLPWLVLHPGLQAPPYGPAVMMLALARLVLFIAAIALSLHALAATWATLRFGFDDGFIVLDRIARGEDDAQPEVPNVLANVGGKAFTATWAVALLVSAVFFVFTLLPIKIELADRVLLLIAAAIAVSFGPSLGLSLWRRAQIRRWVSSLLLCLLALVLLFLGRVLEELRMMFLLSGFLLLVLAWVVLPPYFLKGRWNPPLSEVDRLD